MDTLIFNTLEGAIVALDNLPNDDNLKKREREKIAAHAILEKLLNRNVKIIHDTDNKPFLKDETLKISVSHNRTKIAVIVHSEKNIGIDVEEIQPKILKLAARFLNEKELARIWQSAENYTLAWAAKEAAFKILGKKAVDFRASLEIENIERNDLEGKIFLKFLTENRTLIFYFKILKNNVVVWGIE